MTAFVAGLIVRALAFGSASAAAAAANETTNEIAAQKAAAVLRSSPSCAAKCFETAKIAAFAKTGSVNDFAALCFSALWSEPSLLQCAFGGLSDCHYSDLDLMQAQTVDFMGLCENTVISLSPIPENIANGFYFYDAGVPRCAAPCLDDDYIPNFSKFVQAYNDTSNSSENVTFVQQGAVGNALNLVCENYNMQNYTECAKASCNATLDLEHANNFATNTSAFCELNREKSSTYLGNAWHDLVRLPRCASLNCINDQTFAKESHYFLWTMPTLPKLKNICLTYDAASFEACAFQKCNDTDFSLIKSQENAFENACNHYLDELNVTRSSTPSAATFTSAMIATATAATASSSMGFQVVTTIALIFFGSYVVVVM
ncbi:UNVERIFIED_CONTAM: hypothetical protein HDU68_011708 [Siphonaria sp. JEL0065]|nr:hypothetical protein HDU68_011708 [Siphonaria sp. JEL0065]